MFSTQLNKELLSEANSPASYFSEELNNNALLNNPIPLQAGLMTPPTNWLEENTMATDLPDNIQRSTTTTTTTMPTNSDHANNSNSIANQNQAVNNNNNQTNYAPYDITPDQRFGQSNNQRNHPYQRPRPQQNNNNNLTTPQLLNKIYLQTTNISKQTNRNTINQLLKDGIKREGLKETEASQATITIIKDNSLNTDLIKTFINNMWVKTEQQLCPSIWEEKKRGFIFVQFMNNETKMAFLNSIKHDPFIDNIKNGKQIDSKSHYTKRLIRIEVNRVRENMKLETILKTIQIACGNKIIIENLKEGKLHNGNKTKIVSFYTDANGLTNIADKMKWKIPYYDTSKNIKATLFIKINSKPWLCKDCFTIGNHQCKGKCCGKCSSENHQTKDCDQNEYCINCKIPGHSARDTHCQTYINMLIRNLVQMDIPNSIYAKESRINNLIENIQLK